VSHPDETIEFWLSRTHTELAQVAAALHRYRREVQLGEGLRDVLAARRVVAEIFIVGHGLDYAHCYYGDVRDHDELQRHFHGHKAEFDGRIDAQTFHGVPDNSLDFVISGHVLEHLPDPVGAIREGCRVIRPDGVFLIAVPDMRHTSDCDRPETSIEHLLADEEDGGVGSTRSAYEEHVRYVHPRSRPAVPEPQIAAHVDRIMSAGLDIHFHAWTGDTFAELLTAISGRMGYTVAAHVPVRNESIFVLRIA
jgi:SAM-dependent methyltransferase